MAQRSPAQCGRGGGSPIKGLHSPLPELLEDHAVGEALAADPDAFENPVATQLIQHQMGVQLASLGKKSMHVLFLYAAGTDGERGGASLDTTGHTPPQEGAVTAPPTHSSDSYYMIQV